ncbi:MAG: rho GDP dissociation inhibitor [Ramalina farinacea]|uniref:Rho GDP-dissociation inhibitor n=1 Tax=Ramalina farinacea TaxID=258253 RepID=A0AA43QKK1_9LECA|nr:rho GDP dissociation inhibitor [Ramalina farinacea]
MASQDDDLQASATEGYKIGEKKTVEEYAKLDQNDESLNRWKASLGISSSPPIAVDPKDQRRCVIKTLAMEAEGRPDINIDLTTPGSLESLKSKPFSIKEAAKFRMKANFVVQHDVLSGLKYLQVVKRKGIRVAKTEEMLGSYAPNTQEKPIYEKKFEEDEAPSGMLARGHYEAVSKFTDDDNKEHLKFEWSFDIAKDWK